MSLEPNVLLWLRPGLGTPVYARVGATCAAQSLVGRRRDRVSQRTYNGNARRALSRIYIYNLHILTQFRRCDFELWVTARHGGQFIVASGPPLVSLLTP